VAKRKTKPDLPALTDWRAVDRAVMAVAGLEAQAARLKAEAEEKIRVLREDAAARAAEALEGAAAFLEAIEKFAETHEGDFGKSRSKALPHGRIGWRTVTSIRLMRSSEFVVAALAEGFKSDDLFGYGHTGVPFWVVRHLAGLLQVNLPAEPKLEDFLTKPEAKEPPSKGGKSKPTPGVCRKCGCTETTPCPGGCAWADETKTLCTTCEAKTEKKGKPKTKKKK